MTYLAATWAWFMGLGWIAKLSAGATALVPLTLLNPVLSILGVIWNTITTVVGWIFEGVQNVIAHPVTLSIVVAGFFGGMWTQHDLDKKKIESYKIEAQNVAKKVQGAADVEKAKAAAAIAARDAAKMLPLLEVIPAPVSHVNEDHPVKAAVPPLALDTTPDRVRKPAAVRRGPVCPAMFCF